MDTRPTTRTEEGKKRFFHRSFVRVQVKSRCFSLAIGFNEKNPSTYFILTKTCRVISFLSLPHWEATSRHDLVLSRQGQGHSFDTRFSAVLHDIGKCWYFRVTVFFSLVLKGCTASHFLKRENLSMGNAWEISDSLLSDGVLKGLEVFHSFDEFSMHFEVRLCSRQRLWYLLDFSCLNLPWFGPAIKSSWKLFSSWNNHSTDYENHTQQRKYFHFLQYALIAKDILTQHNHRFVLLKITYCAR